MDEQNFRKMRDFPLVVMPDAYFKVCPECHDEHVATFVRRCHLCGHEYSDGDIYYDDYETQKCVKPMEEYARKVNAAQGIYEVTVESGLRRGHQFYVEERLGKEGEGDDVREAAKAIVVRMLKDAEEECDCRIVDLGKPVEGERRPKAKMEAKDFKTMPDFPLVVAEDAFFKSCPECGAYQYEHSGAKCECCGHDLADVEWLYDADETKAGRDGMESEARRTNGAQTFYEVTVERGRNGGRQFYVKPRMDVDGMSEAEAQKEFWKSLAEVKGDRDAAKAVVMERLRDDREYYELAGPISAK